MCNATRFTWFQVSDVFHKAIESVPSEKIQSGSSDLKTLYDGLVMTESQLLSVSFVSLCELHDTLSPRKCAQLPPLDGFVVFLFPIIQRWTALMANHYFLLHSFTITAQSSDCHSH